jgi:hypothetical protein
MSINVTDAIGYNAWAFIPLKWRPWWLYSLRRFNAVYSVPQVQLESPPPHMKDVTRERNRYLDMMRNLQLGDIKQTVNELLFAVVLCPWGCAEYRHRTGTIPFDTMMLTLLEKVAIPRTTSGLAKVPFCRSVRSDYLDSCHDCHLLNPDWQVWPSVAIDRNLGLVWLTCGDHNGGTKKRYFHCAKVPHCIPASRGDQLTHAVLQSRTLKPMSPKKYNTSYQLHKQCGSFAGIDTCDIRT